MKSHLFLSALLCSLTIPALGAPAFAYITNQGSDTVSVLDLETDKVIADIAVGIKPAGVAVAPQAKRAFITNVESGNVSVIDTEINKVLTQIPAGSVQLALPRKPERFRLVQPSHSGDRCRFRETTAAASAINIAEGEDM